MLTIVCFVDIGGIVVHNCLDVIVCFVDIIIGGIVDHNCLNFLYIIEYVFIVSEYKIYWYTF
jgi:hypothetical protein